MRDIIALSVRASRESRDLTQPGHCYKARSHVSVIELNEANQEG